MEVFLKFDGGNFLFVLWEQGDELLVEMVFLCVRQTVAVELLLRH